MRAYVRWMTVMVVTAVMMGPAPALAQRVSIKMRTDTDEVRAGESFLVSVEISLIQRGGGAIILSRPGIEEYLPPTFGGLVVEDESTSTRTNVGISGTSYYNQYVIEHEYVVKAPKPGTYTIGPARVRVAGHVYQSKPVTVRVLPPRKAPEPILEGETPSPESLSEPFVQVVVSKRKVYVGEPVRVSWYLYSFSRLLKHPKSDLPEAQGFYSKDLLDDLRRQGNYEMSHVRIRGRDFIRTLIFRRMYFPMKPGRLTIGARMVNFVTRRTYINPSRTGGELTRMAAPVEIEVMPLPRDGRPQDMTEDVVGRFTISSSLRATSLKVGDAVDFTITIEGRGLLTGITPTLPKLEWAKIEPNGSPKYEEEVVDHKYIRSRVVCDYVLIVTKEGRWTLPSIRFHYFDPWKKGYQTVSTRTVRISVAPGKLPKGGSKGISKVYVAPSTTNILAPEIRPIREGKVRGSSIRAGMRSNGVLVWLTILPVLLWLGLVGYQWARRRWAPSPETRRARELKAQARRRLREAKSAASSGGKEFYDALGDALLDAASAAIGVTAHGMAQEERQRRLEECTGIRSIGNEFEELLESIDYGRYAPGGESDTSRRELLERVRRMVDTLLSKGRC